MSRVEIWTDGSCPRNPGPGGYAAILRYKGVEKEVVGFHPDTTNNRMEMMAAIMALYELKRPCRVTLTTDSQYLQKGITQWIHSWRRKEWIGVKNRDLWELLDALARKHEVEWAWVRGHAGHPENERCDRLARTQVDANAQEVVRIH